MTTITVTFDPPLPSDSPATFNSKAFDTLGDLNTWSGQANTVAGEVNTNATNAATSAGTASTHASTATTQAGIATTQAGIATTQAGLATTNGAAQVALAAAQVSLATTQANTATTQAGTATTQAGIATTKASEADASAIAAAASAASIAPGSLLTAANPSYTGTLTGGTGVVNLGSGQFVKDASGNVMLGGTPAAWGGSGTKALQFGVRGSLYSFVGTTTDVGNNVYYDGTNYKLLDTAAASFYRQFAGAHSWHSAASAAAGSTVSMPASATLDASGNFGLGVTPSAWGSTYKVVQVGIGGSIFGRTDVTRQVGLMCGAYTNGSNWVYLDGAACARYEQDLGVHYWYTAPSGTAGNPITFTQAMTLDASGNLGLGVPAPSAKLDVASDDATAALRVTTASNQNYQLRIGYRSASLSGEIQAIHVGTAYSDLMLQRDGGNVLVGASGNLLVGTTNSTANQTSGFSVLMNGTVTAAYLGHASGTSSGASYMSYLYNGGSIGSIAQSGTTAVVYNTTSDHRLKTNVRPSDAKSFGKIEFVDFEWVDGRHDCGVIADQLASVYPDLVFGEKDATEEVEYEVSPAVPAVLDEDGNEVTPAVEAVMGTKTQPKYQQVNYTGLIARMGTVVQRHEKTIEAMQAQLDAQNTAMQLLASRLAALEAAA